MDRGPGDRKEKEERGRQKRLLGEDHCDGRCWVATQGLPVGVMTVWQVFHEVIIPLEMRKLRFDGSG